MKIAFVGKGGSGKTTLASLLARHLAAAGHLAAAVAQVADTTPEAQACLRAAMRPWLQRSVGEYVSIAAAPRLRCDPRACVEHLLQIHPVGTPERCAERLAASAERTGVRRFLLMVEG